MIKINGVEADAAGRTLAEFLDADGYDLTRIAVELNGEVVPRNRYEGVMLEDGDSVEVVSFVGGG